MARKTLTRRDMLKLTGGALGAAVLQACGSATPPSTSSASAGSTSAPATAAQELGPAELVFFFGANVDEAKTRQNVIDAFTQKFPQITIKTNLAEGDPVQELQTQFAGGAGPDVMMAWELTYSGLAERGLYADLGAFIQKDAEFTQNVVPDHVPALLDMFKWNSKQYVLPEQYAGVVLYYNKKLFQEAGLTPPSNDWKDTSWTYAKFLETAQALTKTDANGRVTQYGFVDPWWPPLSATVWATSNGGNWFDQYVNPTKSTITDPKLVEGLQFYADLSNKHHVAPTAEESQAQSGPDLFMSGKAAMALVGHWFYPAFSAKEGLEFDIGVLPVGPQGTTPKTDLGSTGLAISATTKYPDQAWEFIKFATGPEGQRIVAESGLFVPVLKSVGKSDAFLKSHTKIENVQVFIDAIENSVPLPISPVWNQVADVWARELDTVMRGKATAADVAAKLEPQINALLAG